MQAPGGGAYLVGLGVYARASWRSPSTALPRPRRGAGRSFAQGLVSNLANLKMAVFFLSLLPSSPPAPSRPRGAGAALRVMTVIWLAGYALVVHRARNLLQRNAFDAGWIA